MESHGLFKKKEDVNSSIDAEKHFHTIDHDEIRRLFTIGDFSDDEDDKMDAIESSVALCKIIGDDKLNYFFRDKYSKSYFPLFYYLVLHDDSLEVTEILIQKGLNVNLQDADGNTPLLILIACADHDKALRIIDLLDKNKDVCNPNFDIKGYTSGKSSDDRDYSNTALTLVLAKGYEKESYHCVQGNMPDQTFTVDNNHLAVASRLLKAGANPNAPGPDGLTPLHIAFIRRDVKAAELLLKNGADINLVDNAGLKPTDYLKLNYKEACVILHRITQSFYLLNERVYNHNLENMSQLVSMTPSYKF